MALKVVPAGDELCDVHNRRTPHRYVCEACLKEFGVESATRAPLRRRYRPRRLIRGMRSRIDPKVVVGAAVVALLAVLVVLALSAGGGGGETVSTDHPSHAEVVRALHLVPNANGKDWSTPDDACGVTSIRFGAAVQPGSVAGDVLIEVTNDDQSVGAVVLQQDPSLGPGTCASRIGRALRTNF